MVNKTCVWIVCSRRQMTRILTVSWFWAGCWWWRVVGGWTSTNIVLTWLPCCCCHTKNAQFDWYLLLVDGVELSLLDTSLGGGGSRYCPLLTNTLNYLNIEIKNLELLIIKQNFKHLKLVICNSSIFLKSTRCIFQWFCLSKTTNN